MVHDRDPAVLRVAALDDVQIGHHLEPADDRRGHRRLDEQDILELAVDAVANSQAVFLGIEMNVGGLAVAGAFQDLVDQLRQGDGRGFLLKVLADIAVMLGAIGRERQRRQTGTRLGWPEVVGSLAPWPLSRSKASSLSRSGEIRFSSRIDCRRSRW